MRETEEQRVESHSSAKSSIIIALFLIAAVLVMAFMVFLQSKDKGISLSGVRKAVNSIGPGSEISSKEASTENSIEIPFQEDRHTAVCTYRDMLAKSNGDGITFLDKQGRQIGSIGTPFSSPRLQPSGAYLLAADLGGKYLCVIEGTDIKWEVKTDGDLINTSINTEGYVTIVQESKGYRNRVRVFDPSGIEKFYRNIAEDRIINGAVAPSGRQLALLSLNTAGLSASPSVQFFDILGKPYEAKSPQTEGIFVLMSYFEDDSLIASSENTLVYYSSKREEGWRFKPGKIISIAACPGKTTVVAYRDKEAGVNPVTHIGFFNSKGRQTAETLINGQVKSIRASGGVVSVNTLREVYFLNQAGKLIGKYSAVSDISGVYFFDKTEAAIVTKNSIVIFKL